MTRCNISSIQFIIGNAAYHMVVEKIVSYLDRVLHMFVLFHTVLKFAAITSSLSAVVGRTI